MDMSETHGTTGTQNDDASREPGVVEFSPISGGTSDTHGTGAGTDVHGTDTTGTGTGTTGSTGTSSTGDTKDVAKEEARATGEQAREGARHVADIGKDEAKNVARETTQQAKELWRQTRSELLDQSAQQQTRVAEGLRSLSQELSSMARGSDQQGVASDLAQQASQRIGDVAGWLDQRDPGSLVSEVKRFARQRPGTFLATAAAIGLIGGRLSRGLVAEHQDQDQDQSGSAGSEVGAGPSPMDHSTSGYSAYGSPSGTARSGGDYPVTDTMGEAGGVHSGTGPLSGTGRPAGGYPR
jgi:hypothetical protein